MGIAFHVKFGSNATQSFEEKALEVENIAKNIEYFFNSANLVFALI